MKIYWSNWFQDYIFQNAFHELRNPNLKHKLKVYYDYTNSQTQEMWEVYSGHEDDLIFICEVE